MALMLQTVLDKPHFMPMCVVSHFDIGVDTYVLVNEHVPSAQGISLRSLDNL